MQFNDRLETHTHSPIHCQKNVAYFFDLQIRDFLEMLLFATTPLNFRTLIEQVLYHTANFFLMLQLMISLFSAK